MKPKFQLFFVLLLFFVKQLIYIVVTPPWMGPDETRHVGYIEALERRRERLFVHNTSINPTLIQPGSSNLRAMNSSYARMPIQKAGDWYVKRNIEETGSHNWIVQHPPLYHLLMTPVYLFFRETLTSLSIVFWLRLINSLLAVVMLLYIYKFARNVLGSHGAALTGIILFANWPTFSHSATLVTNDVLLSLLAVLVFYGLSKLEKFSLKNTLSLSLLTSAALSTKLFAIFLVPLFYIRLAMDFFFKRIKIKNALLYGAVFFLMAGVFGGWYYIQNHLETGEAVFGRLSRVVKDQQTREKEFSPKTKIPYEPYSISGLKWAFGPKGLNLPYQWVRNYIGVYGWGMKGLRFDLLYLYITIYGLLLVIGGVTMFKKCSFTYFIYLIPFVLLFTALIYKNYMSAFAWNGWIRGLWGRYYLYASVPVFLLMAEGGRHLYEKLACKRLSVFLSFLVLVSLELRLFFREYLEWVYF